MKTIELSEDEWRLVAGDLPRGSELRSYVKDLIDDAMTFGTAEGEFDEGDYAKVMALGFSFLPSN